MENLKIFIKWIGVYLIGIYSVKFISPLIIYFLCILGFLTGFLLRVFGKYHGKEEPLILDFSTFLLSSIIFLLSFFFQSINYIQGLFLIFLPHLVYNLIKTFLPFI